MPTFVRKLTTKKIEESEEELKVIEDAQSWFVKSKGPLQDGNLPSSTLTAESDLVK